MSKKWKSDIAPQNKQLAYKTTKGERLSYGIYSFGQMMFFMIVANFLQLYMTDSGIPATIVGGIFMVAKVWDAVNDPLFGVIVDKAQLKSGKFLPWVRISTLLIPAATIFMFAMPIEASVQIKAIWITVAYMLWDTSYTICDVPIFALATSMTDEMKEREWLYLLGRLFMFIGGLLVAILVPLIYPAIGWFLTIVIMSVLALVTMIPVSFKAKERVKSDTEKSPTIGSLVKYLFKNKPLLIFNGALIIASLTNTASALTNYVAIYCLGGTQWISILGLIMTLPMLISIILAKQIIKKVDKFILYMICTGINLLLGVLMFFIGHTDIVPLLIIITIRALFASTSGILVVLFSSDCAEYGHFATGERAQGIAFSIQTFTAKITTAVSGAAGMFMLGAVGFVEGEGAVQTAETISWIWRMYTIIPVVAGTLAFILLCFGYKLRDRDVSLMMKSNSGEISRDEAIKGFSREYS